MGELAVDRLADINHSKAAYDVQHHVLTEFSSVFTLNSRSHTYLEDDGDQRCDEVLHECINCAQQIYGRLIVTTDAFTKTKDIG